MLPDPKPKKPYRDKKYLKFIRSMRCAFCYQPAEAHHVRRSCWGAGASQKPHDYVAVARCRGHHGPDYEDDIEFEIIKNLLRFLRGREREVIDALMEIIVLTRPEK